MATKVQKWGNSLGVRLPKSLVDQLHLSAGSEVEFVRGKRGLEMIPVGKPSLDDLIAHITPENCHDETDWGAPQGNEVW